MSIFKVVFTMILGSILCTTPTLAQSVQTEALDQLLANQKLSQPQDLLEPLYGGEKTIKVVVTLRPNEAARALEKPVAETKDNATSTPGNVYGDVHYDLSSEAGKQALAVAVEQKLSAFLSDVRSVTPKGGDDATTSTVSPIVITNKFKYVFGFAAEVTLEGLNQLLENEEVLLIEENLILKPHLMQGIPLMNGSSARGMYNGSGVAVAVADTGIDTTHPRLDGGKVLGGYDFGMDDSNFQPAGNAHGTAVAGIVAGDLGTVGNYIGGVAPGASLYGLKISNDTNHSATAADMVDAWEWALTHQNDSPANPILVVNTSFGGGRYLSSCDTTNSSMTQAALNGVNGGITFLVSSGNDGYCDSMGWPACITHVNAVGAVYDANIGTPGWCVSANSCLVGKVPNSGCSTGWAYFEPSTAADQVTAYSNSDTNLAFFASSHNATTTDISGVGGYVTGDYAPNFGGTSAASPYAAGAAAVLQHAAKSKNGSYLTPAQVKSIFASTGNNVSDGKVSVTKPRINLGNAVASLDGPSSDDDFLLMVMPPILAAVQGGTPPPPVTNSQWGVFNEVCCPSSSATYEATQGGQFGSSTTASCSSDPTFSGYLNTTPGSKTINHAVLTSGCGNSYGSNSYSLQSGKYYLWVLELINGSLTAVLYSGDISSVNTNTMSNSLGEIGVLEDMTIEQSIQLTVEQSAEGQSKFQSRLRSNAMP
jgi:subtilisin family serine protease